MTTGTGANLHRRSRFGDHDSPIERIVSDVPIQFDKTITMSNVGGAVEFGSAVIAGLPVGDLLVLGGVLHLDLIVTDQANISQTFTPSYALGTTATADNNLGAPATDFDFLAGKTAGAATDGVSPHQKQVLDGTAIVAGAAGTKYIDNNAANKTLSLNVTIPDAQQTGAGTVRVRGSLKLAYVGLSKNS